VRFEKRAAADPVAQCVVPGAEEHSALEIPAWMFDRAS
jgi:hypothetical protein